MLHRHKMWNSVSLNATKEIRSVIVAAVGSSDLPLHMKIWKYEKWQQSLWAQRISPQLCLKTHTSILSHFNLYVQLLWMTWSCSFIKHRQNMNLYFAQKCKLLGEKQQGTWLTDKINCNFGSCRWSLLDLDLLEDEEEVRERSTHHCTVCGGYIIPPMIRRVCEDACWMTLRGSGYIYCIYLLGEFNAWLGNWSIMVIHDTHEQSHCPHQTYVMVI